MKKIVYIGTVGLTHYIEYMRHVCEGTYVKSFDNKKHATLEDARIAKDIMFGVSEGSEPQKTTIYINKHLPKAHKTRNPKAPMHGFIACRVEDVPAVMQRLITYINDPDNAGQEAPILFKKYVPSYRKYKDLAPKVPLLEVID